jgi:hypothetical protein
MRMCAGDWVEVLSKEDILRTLDKNGRLDGLPFMPQMFKYCGQRFRIYKRAYKTCDTVSGHYTGRRLQDGFHLSLRCDGQAYGGCQAGCLIFWKSAWLKPVDGPAQVQYVPKRVPSPREEAPSPPRSKKFRMSASSIQFTFLVLIAVESTSNASCGPRPGRNP